MDQQKTTSLGMISVICAVAAIVATGIFFVSGLVLPGIAVERTIVIVQLSSALAIPAFAFLGCVFGIVSMVREKPATLAMVSTAVNGMILLMTGIALTMFVIASSEIMYDAEIPARPDMINVQVEAL